MLNANVAETGPELRPVHGPVAWANLAANAFPKRVLFGSGSAGDLIEDQDSSAIVGCQAFRPGLPFEHALRNRRMVTGGLSDLEDQEKIQVPSGETMVRRSILAQVFRYLADRKVHPDGEVVIWKVRGTRHGQLATSRLPAVHIGVKRTTGS
jgi:hypothetical protein